MDKLEEVKKLKRLFDDGIIDSQDFIEKKAELLGISKKEENIMDKMPESNLKNQSKTLEARDEHRNKKIQEQKIIIDKGINKIKRFLKWVLSIMLWLMGILLISMVDSGIINLLTGIIFLFLGSMACPKITDYTQKNLKFVTYTKHKTIIAIFTVILWIVLVSIFPT